MKCVHCGSELKIESGYCEKCGTEVRVVPDFNALDDMIETALSPSDAIKNTSKTPQVDDFGETRIIDNPYDEIGKKDAKLLRKISIVASGAVVIIALIVVVAVISNSGSYSSQIKAAQKAYAAGNEQKALEHYSNALDMSQSLELYETIGHIYADDLSSDEAYEYYIQAVNLGTKDISIYDWLTFYYLKSNDEAGINELIGLVSFEEAKDRILDLVPVFPSISLESGNYTGKTFVELSGSEHNKLYYTLDGTKPDKDNGIMYEGPIELPVGATAIKVCSYSEAADIYSAINEAEYLVSVDPPANPVIDVASGIYPIGTLITVHCEDEDATIRYTWNGASPNELSAIYTGPLEMPEGENTLRVIAINSYGISSKVVEVTYRCGVEEP